MLDTYRKLLQKAKGLMIWESIKELEEWDYETMMPQNGTDQRSMQMALIEKRIHKGWIDPEIKTLITQLQGSSRYEDLSSEDKRNVYLMQRYHDRETKLPEELVEAIAKHSIICNNTWKKAKAAKDYSIFKQDLEKMVELIKTKAHYLAPDKDPYDALIDNYEPGATSARIAQVFGPLRNWLAHLVKRCISSSNKRDLSFLNRFVPVDVQREISRRLMEFTKYDLTRGRLDETEHAYTYGLYDDVRICTHYHERDFTSSLFSVLHEAGHALYEQNVRERSRYQPIGRCCSAGIDESMSRFVENVVGRSEPFWIYFLPELKRTTGTTFNDVDLDLIMRAVNDVKPSKIRVDADEVTYSLHVILRFEVERELIAEKISVDELPQIWKEKMDEFLGVTVENDSEGVLQDIHWANGLYGYFPAYALGNLYDGMFIETLNRKSLGWQNSVAVGDFSKVLSWLKENVYEKGNIMDPFDMVKTITGKEIDSQPYMNYLNEKVKPLFDL